jgi:hypothetical protein
MARMRRSVRLLASGVIGNTDPSEGSIAGSWPALLALAEDVSRLKSRKLRTTLLTVGDTVSLALPR